MHFKSAAPLSAVVMALLSTVSAAPAVIGTLHTRGSTVAITTAMCKEYGAGDPATSLCMKLDDSKEVNANDCTSLKGVLTDNQAPQTVTLPPNKVTVGWANHGACMLGVVNTNADPVAGGDITVTFDQHAVGVWVEEWSNKCFTGGREKSFNAVWCTITSPEVALLMFNAV